MRGLWWWQTTDSAAHVLEEWCAARLHWLAQAPATRESLVSHLFRREVLQRVTGIATHAQRFAVGDKGKPELIGSALHFSVAHSHGWHLLLLSDVPCGVDVEPWDRSVTKLMTPAALKRFAERDALKNAQDFLRCWTMKEAFAKCRGDSVWQVLAEPLEAHADGWRVPGKACGYAELKACVAWVVDDAAGARPVLHHFVPTASVSAS